MPATGGQQPRVTSPLDPQVWVYLVRFFFCLFTSYFGALFSQVIAIALRGVVSSSSFNCVGRPSSP